MMDSQPDLTSRADPRTGARRIAEGVYLFTSGAYAMNAGVVIAGEPAGSGPSAPRIRAALPSARKLEGEARAPGGAGARPGRRRALLTDPAYFPSDLERIAAFLEDRGAEVSHIVLTHSDWDHVVGPPRWPEAAVVASSEFPVRAAEDGERITASLADFDGRLYVTRPSPFAIPEPTTLVGSPSDLVWSGPPVHLIPAGGHTRDGLFVLLRREKILFAGDHLSNLEIPFVGDSVAAYSQTMRTARALFQRGEAEWLVPGHGDACGASEALERIDEDADYLARLDSWVREVRRTVETVEGILERCDEVVFRKGAANPDVQTEHRSNVARLARLLGAPGR